MMDGKRVSDSETEQLRVVIYPDINGFGRLFGGRPTKVPPLILENDGERMEWENAKKRRDLRLMRKKEGF